MKPQQVIERLFWSGVVSGLAVLTGSALFGWDVDALQAAATAAIGAVLNGITQVGRYRLSVLPDPGQGLPGARVE